MEVFCKKTSIGLIILFDNDLSLKMRVEFGFETIQACKSLPNDNTDKRE